MFNTYHQSGDTTYPDRTPTNWTFNFETPYNSRREALTLGSISPIDISLDLNPGDGCQFTRYQMRWEQDSIEWYINNVLIHRVLDPDHPDFVNTAAGSIQQFQEILPVYQGRMYLLASMHLGNPGFEGSIDTTLFNVETREGPSVEIDYIRVWQKNDGWQAWCGFTGGACDGVIGMPPPQ